MPLLTAPYGWSFSPTASNIHVLDLIYIAGNDPSIMPVNIHTIDTLALSQKVKAHAAMLGFQQAGITDADAGLHKERFLNWLAAGYQGNMDYMSAHGEKRFVPDQLIEGTTRVISVRMDYLPEHTTRETMREVLRNPAKGYISRYTLGRDYHKLVRKRLNQLAAFVNDQVPGFQYRAFVDSAPVLERGFGQKAGLGWIGKNAMLINRKAGSYFFIGEIYTNLPLEMDAPYEDEHCGRCSACMDICPTQAFVGPYVLDARRCISYLTIELKGSIPEDLRRGMGNRIFGCDDCQLVCPWNRFAKPTSESDFSPRHHLDNRALSELFAWDEATFLSRTEGSAIRRTGYENWLRNIAVALGNASTNPEIIAALQSRVDHPSEIVREHVQWALTEHARKRLS